MNKPLPILCRRVLKKALPASFYRRYIGRHEDGSMAIWRKLAAQVQPGGAILDVGACHGEYALAAKDVNRAAVVIAFEPDPANYAALEIACRGKSIELRQAAVSDKEGIRRFTCNGQTGKISTNGDGVECECVTLSGISAALVKIDVEGFEESVLRGWGTSLYESRPTILCEVLSDAAGAKVMAALPGGYKYFRINENRGIAEKPRIYRDDWRYKNWLLVPAENASSLAAA